MWHINLKGVELRENKDRSAEFPNIERRYGVSVASILREMDGLNEESYKKLAEFLKTRYNMSRSHSNTLIMYRKGYTGRSKFSNIEEYLLAQDNVEGVKALRALLEFVREARSEIEIEISWNKPTLRLKGRALINFALTKRYILINTLVESPEILKYMESKGYKVNKRSIIYPFDKLLDEEAIVFLINKRIAQEWTSE